MTFLDAFAGHNRAALALGTVAATYRKSATYNVRAASLAAAGATSLNFSNVPVDLTATAVGDVFKAGLTTHTVTNAVVAAAGTLTGVTFTPALTASVAANTQVVLSRAAEHDVTAIVEQVDGYGLVPGIYAGGDYRATIFGLPDGVEPSGSGGDKLIWNGKELTVKEEIGRDPSGAAWIVRCQ